MNGALENRMVISDQLKKLQDTLFVLRPVIHDIAKVTVIIDRERDAQQLTLTSGRGILLLEEFEGVSSCHPTVWASCLVSDGYGSRL